MKKNNDWKVIPLLYTCAPPAAAGQDAVLGTSRDQSAWWRLQRVLLQLSCIPFSCTLVRWHDYRDFAGD